MIQGKVLRQGYKFRNQDKDSTFNINAQKFKYQFLIFLEGAKMISITAYCSKNTQAKRLTSMLAAVEQDTRGLPEAAGILKACRCKS